MCYQEFKQLAVVQCGYHGINMRREMGGGSLILWEISDTAQCPPCERAQILMSVSSGGEGAKGELSHQ